MRLTTLYCLMILPILATAACSPRSTQSADSVDWNSLRYEDIAMAGSIKYAGLSR